MSVYFTKIKSCWPQSVRAVQRSVYDRFQPSGGHGARSGSCRAQFVQPLQIPTDTFELQVRPVRFASHIPHSPIILRKSIPQLGYVMFVPRRLCLLQLRNCGNSFLDWLEPACQNLNLSIKNNSALPLFLLLRRPFPRKLPLLGARQLESQRPAGRASPTLLSCRPDPGGGLCHDLGQQPKINIKKLIS